MESLLEKTNNDRRINFKKSNNSSIISNSNNKMSNYSIESQTHNDLSSNFICPKPNQVNSEDINLQVFFLHKNRNKNLRFFN